MKKITSDIERMEAINIFVNTNAGKYIIIVNLLR